MGVILACAIAALGLVLKWHASDSIPHWMRGTTVEVIEDAGVPVVEELDAGKCDSILQHSVVREHIVLPGAAHHKNDVEAGIGNEKP